MLLRPVSFVAAISTALAFAALCACSAVSGGMPAGTGDRASIAAVPVAPPQATAPLVAPLSTFRRGGSLVSDPVPASWNGDAHDDDLAAMRTQTVVGSTYRTAEAGLQDLPTPTPAPSPTAGPPYLLFQGEAFHAYVPGGSFTKLGPDDKIFAPTTHWPTQCFEIGTRYFRENGQVDATGAVQVYDLCQPRGKSAGTWKAMFRFKNHAFKSTYTTQLGSGLYYEVLVVLEAGKWHPFIFNFATDAADELLAENGQSLAEPTTATVSNPAGWSVFETAFHDPGPCPRIPTVSDTTITYFLSAGSSFWSSPLDLSSSLFSGGQCFVDRPGEAGASYTAQYTSAGFQVTSSR